MNIISSRYSWLLLITATTLLVTQYPVAQEGQIDAGAENNRMIVKDHIAAGLLLVKLGELDAAEKHFNAAENHFDAAEEHFTSAIDNAPDNARALAHRGLLRFARDSFSEALPDLNKSLSLPPDGIEELRVELLIKSALCELDSLKNPQQEWEDAEETLADLTRAAEEAAETSSAAAEAARKVETNEDLAAAAAEAQTVADDAETARAAAEENVKKIKDAVTVIADRAIERCSEALGLEPASPDAYLTRGKAHFQKRDFPSAISDLNEVIRLDENNVEARLVLSQVLIQLGLLDEATVHLTDALGIDPENIQALLLRGRVYLLAEMPDEAMADFDEVLRLEPENTDALNGKGDVLTSTENYLEAIKIYSLIIAADPGNTDALIDRARCHEKLGDLANAIVDLSAAIALDPDLNEILKAKLASLHIQQGEQLQEDGQWEDALASFRAAGKADERARGKAEGAESRLYRERANDLSNNNFPEAAIADLLRCLELNKLDVIAWRMLGDIYVNLGRHEEAVESYTSLLALKPDDEDSLFARGRSLIELGKQQEELGQIEEAQDKFRRAAIDFTSIIENPLSNSRDVAHIERARTRMRLLLFTEAIKDYLRAIHIVPDHLEGLTKELAEAYQLRGEQLFGDREFAAAIKDFKEALKYDESLLPKIAPSFSTSYYEIGKIYAIDKKFNLAIQFFTEALRINSAMPEVLVARGWAFLEIGDLDKAHDDFTAAIEMQPDKNLYVEALLGRAKVAIAQKNIEAAIVDLTEALDLRLRPADKQLLARCYETLATVLLEKKNRTSKDLELAIGYLDSAIENDANLKVRLTGVIVQALLDLARLELAQFDEQPDEQLINKVIAHLLRISDLVPNAINRINDIRVLLADAYHRRGYLAYIAEDYDRAISDYDEAMKTDANITVKVSPYIALAYFQRGKVFFHRRELQKAIDDFQQALVFNAAIRPIVQGPLAVSYAKLAYQELQKERTAQAIALLLTAVGEEPKFVQNLALATMLKGNPLVTLEEEVIADFEEQLAFVHQQKKFHIRLDPVPQLVRDELGRQYERARIYRECGLPLKALAAIDLVIQQGHAIPLHFYFRGIILFELHEPRERWQTDFEVGSFLETLGFQETEYISIALTLVQGCDRMALQDQRKLGPSIMKLWVQHKLFLLQQQLQAAQAETQEFQTEFSMQDAPDPGRPK